jgi:hypothetical protein
VRLCQWLRQTYGITDLYHAGISGDNPARTDTKPRTDCHGQGRAVDFVGARGFKPADGSEFVLTVADDWGGVAVTGLTDEHGDWPPGTGRDTAYRLDSPDAADPFAAAFFRDLYGFIATEWQDRTKGPDESVPTSIAEPSMVMHPDHPDSNPGKPNGREAHKGHIHMQIGMTGTEA